MKLDDVLMSMAGSRRVLTLAQQSMEWYDKTAQPKLKLDVQNPDPAKLKQQIEHYLRTPPWLPKRYPKTIEESIDYGRTMKALQRARQLLGHLDYDADVPPSVARRIQNLPGYALDDVLDNRAALLEQGTFEEKLLSAFRDCALNNASYSRADFVRLFKMADRERLRAAGDPLPGPGPFTLYRGVAGIGRYRRVRGYSWTASLQRAKWFARRLPHLGDPAVYVVKVPAEWVLAYTNDRKEDEFLLLLPRGAKVTKIWPRAKRAGATVAEVRRTKTKST